MFLDNWSDLLVCVIYNKPTSNIFANIWYFLLKGFSDVSSRWVLELYVCIEAVMCKHNDPIPESQSARTIFSNASFAPAVAVTILEYLQNLFSSRYCKARWTNENDDMCLYQNQVTTFLLKFIIIRLMMMVTRFLRV